MGESQESIAYAGKSATPEKTDLSGDVRAEKPGKVLKSKAVTQKFSGYLRLLVYAEPNTLDISLLIIGLLLAIASGVPFPILGIIFGQLIDDFNSATCYASEDTAGRSAYQSAVDSKILYVVYLAIAQFVMMYIHLVCWSLGGARLAQRLREHYFRSLLRQEPSYFDSLPAGEVSSRLNGDIQTIRSGTSEKVGICLSSASFFVTAYVVAFVKDAKLAGILVSLIPAYFIMSLVGGKYIEKFSGRMSDFVASASSIASEGLSHVTVVHAFSASARLEAKFSDDLLQAQKEGIKKAVATGAQSGLMYFIAYAANGLAFWQGSRVIADAVGRDAEGATVGTTFTVIFILVDATLILSQVAPFLQIFGAATAAFQKLQKDMDHESAINGISDTDGGSLPSVEGRIEFRNVSFAYPARPDHLVLSDVSFVCPVGKHTAIVGLSGSGKSTVAGLTTRLYDPGQGSIWLDGHNLKEINTRQARSYMSLVQQESVLLDRSILENIAHGLVNSSQTHTSLRKVLLGPTLGQISSTIREGKDLDTAAGAFDETVREIIRLVKQAAVSADAANFIDGLQHGYGTNVGSGGSLLSGGQKQRIALARALIREPTILILDEATASLDSKSERKILEAIDHLGGRRTMISIAHRLSTIRDADIILVMRDGKIVEHGTHEKLMACSGAYANLVHLQNVEAQAKESNFKFRSPGTISTPGQTLTEKIQNGEKDMSSIELQQVEDPKKTGLDHEASAARPHSAEISTDRTSTAITKGLLPIFRPHLFYIIIALIAASIVGSAFSAEAVIFGNTVGSLNPCKDEDSIRSRGSFFGIMFFVLAIIEFFANLTSWSAFGYSAEKMLHTVRVLSFRALFEQDLQWHQASSRTPSGLLSYLTNDANLLGGLSGSTLGTIFSIVVNLTVAIIMTHIVAWKIAIVCLAIVPLLLGVGLMQLHVLAEFEERHENAFNKSVQISVEAVNSIKTIAALSLEHETLATYRRTLQAPRKETTRVTLYANLWLALAYFIGNLAYALAYWWGSKQIIAGSYSQTQFLIVVFSLLVSAQLWSTMFALAPEISSARGAAARILGLLDLGSSRDLNDKNSHSSSNLVTSTTSTSSLDEKDIEAGPSAGSSAPDRTLCRSHATGVGVNFHHVDFSYPARPDVQILHKLNLEIKPGQFCALVGPSGAGKSTIISLLERMYLPSSGRIVIDNSDITRRTHDLSFRDDIGFVPQDSVLFDGSIKFNIALGARPSAVGSTVSDSEIEKACRLANMHSYITTSLPDKYDTSCGANGGRLSGGQKQRLAIARALIRRPRLLILDESTSALDAESETLLQQGINQARKELGFTVVAIAHRLSTIKAADVIFVIDEGRCVDQGTHEELMARNESYRVNAQHQSLGG